MTKPKTIDYTFIHDKLIEKGMKQSSATTYINKMKRVMRGMYNGDINPKVSTLKKSHQKVIDYISGDDFKNSNIRKVNLMAVSHLFDIYELGSDKFMPYVKDWSSLADAESITNDKAIEKINEIDFDAIKANIELTNDPTDRLMMTFYSHLPPLRQQDYSNLLITSKEDKDQNHINMKKKLLVIYNHKTDRIHGQKVIPLPQTVIDEIKRYTTQTKTDRIFNISSSGFTRRMTRLFGCSTGTFRKAYITQKSPHMNSQQLADLAYIMGHKISTSVISYKKTHIHTEPELQKEEPEDMSETSSVISNETE